MTSIQKRDNGSWRARYRDAAGKEHARHFKRKVDAEAWLDEVTTAKVTGVHTDPKKGRTKMSEVADSWVKASVDWKETTRATNVAIVRKHVLPRWGDVQVAQVEPADVQEWVADLNETDLSPRTVRKIFFVLSGVLRYAVRVRMIAVNPAAEISLPSHETTGKTEEDGSESRRYLSAVEVEELADAAGAGRLIVFTLAYTGLRWGEMAALRVRDVNFVRSRLSVSRAVAEVDGKLVWSTPKDRKPRTVPMPVFLRDELEKAVEGRGPDDLLFQAARGGVLRSRTARRAWFDGAVDDLGLFGLTPHGLRHTAASLAVQAGANVLAVQRMLGHKKASMTLDVYADLFDGDLDEVAGRLEKMRAGAAADYLRTLADPEGLRLVE